MFTVLSNTDRINLAAVPRLAGATAEDTPRIEEMPRIVEEPFTYDPPEYTSSAMPQDRYFSHDAAHDVQQSDTTRPHDAPRFEPPEPPEPVREPIREPVREACDETPTVDSVPRVHDDHREQTSHADDAAQPTESRETERPAHRVDTEELDDEMSKRTVLLDLQQLELQGVRLTKEWSMNDRLSDMTLELRRHVLALDEKNNVGMMKNGMKLLFTGIEMANTRLGLLDLEGWSSQACAELSKQDANLSRIYRKYWRRSTSNSPEADIALSILGSMGYYHMKRSMAKQVMSRAAPRPASFARRRPASPSSEEEPP